MAYDYEFGSSTAKGGFIAEKTITNKFNNWHNDDEAQTWLKILGYNLHQIEKIVAIGIPPRISNSFAQQLGFKNEEDKQFKKADIQVQLTIVLNGGILKRENISAKKANSTSNFNQVDKRKVATYQQLWKFDGEVAEMLKLFTGETSPSKNSQLLRRYCNKNVAQLSDYRRIYLNDLLPEHLNKLVGFFQSKKNTILLDIIKGRGALCAEWLMVVQYNKVADTTTWALININDAITMFSVGDVKLTPKGSLQLSNGISMQRKGGTPDPTSLQFKIKPLIVFDHF